MKKLVIILALMCPSAFAQSGADVLLDQLGEKPKAPVEATTTNTQALHNISIQGDAFQQQFAIAALGQELSFDVHQWADLVTRGEFAKAAHLWSALQSQIPDGFRNEAQAAQTYLLWKLDLRQAFFNSWVENLKNPAYARSTPELTLETIVTPHLDVWLVDHPVEVNPRQKEILSALNIQRPFAQNVKAWTGLRNPVQANASLKTLTPGNKLIPYLVDTSIYQSMKTGDLKTAAKTLKYSDEPTIAKSQDVKLLASHDLSIARILYQAGQMQAAAEFYKKIPNGLPQFVDAQEELAWVYLRLGEMSKLRGTLEGLASPVFKDRFQPEVYLLRSISDLKMCLYDRVEEDLKDFTKSNAGWAKRMDVALSGSAPRPDQPDTYSLMAEKRVEQLKSEMVRVSQLGEQSITATLPAVGWQKHWTELKKDLQADLEAAQKNQHEEYARQWKNQRFALAEAIRKMRFVKVEFLSQVRTLTLAQDPTSAKNLLASNSDSLPTKAVIGEGGEGEQMNFAATNEIWPDELFKLRSAAQAQCLKKAGRK